MLKIYRALKWLTLPEAQDFVGQLVGSVLPAEVLRQFGRERKIPVYVNIGLPAIKGFASSTKEDVFVAGMRQVLNPDMLDTDEDLACAILKHDDDFWIVELPPSRRKLMFLSDDVEAFAERLNREAVCPTFTDTAKPAHLLLIAALLKLLKEPVTAARRQGMTQSVIKGEILDRFQLRGLGDRSLEKMFSDANKAFDDVNKARVDAD